MIKNKGGERQENLEEKQQLQRWDWKNKSEESGLRKTKTQFLKLNWAKLK